MPTAARRPCTVPGCGELSSRGRCTGHEAEADRRKGTTTARGYGADWQRCRADYLLVHPWCEWCRHEATEVDHRDGRPKGPLRLHWPNLRSLCGTCHRRRTNRDQPGGVLRRI
ncbi:MAG: HNH endonuclease [Pseudonocardiales bacterium]